MLVTLDKRGSINLPAALRRELGLKAGTHLELSVEAGGSISLHPVTIYRAIRLNESGLSKLQEARNSGIGNLPDWVSEEMRNAETDSEQEIS